MNEQRSKLIPIALTVVISAIVFGSSGYYLGKTSDYTARPMNYTSEKFVKGTENWNTYRSKKYNYLVKYPEDWKIVLDSENGNLADYKLANGQIAILAVREESRDVTNYAIKLDPAFDAIKIKVFDSTKTNIDEIAKNMWSSIAGTGREEIRVGQFYKIGGRDATLIAIRTADAIDSLGKQYVLSSGDYLYAIEIGNSDISAFTVDDEVVLNKMIKTFQLD